MARARLSTFDQDLRNWNRNQPLDITFVAADATGQFRMDTLGPGLTVNIAAWCEGYAIAARWGILVPVSGQQEVDFVLQPEGRLVATVNEDFGAVQDLYAAAKLQRNDPSLFPYSTWEAVGANRQVVFSQMPTGRYLIELRRQDTLLWSNLVDVVEGSVTELHIGSDNAAGAVAGSQANGVTGYTELRRSLDKIRE